MRYYDFYFDCIFLSNLKRTLKNQKSIDKVSLNIIDSNNTFDNFLHKFSDLFVFRCYLVKCYNEEKCSPLPASDYSFDQKMAFVSPWLFEKRKKISKLIKICAFRAKRFPFTVKFVDCLKFSAWIPSFDKTFPRVRRLFELSDTNLPSTLRKIQISSFFSKSSFRASATPFTMHTV